MQNRTSCNPEQGHDDVKPGDDGDYSDVDSKLGDDSNAGDDLNVDENDEYDPLCSSNPAVCPGSETREDDGSTRDKQSSDTQGETSKYPDYCRTITVKGM
jgi:hypothetical protein